MTWRAHCRPCGRTGGTDHEPTAHASAEARPVVPQVRKARSGKPHEWGPAWTTEGGDEARRCRVCSVISTWPGARQGCGYHATGSLGAQLKVVRAEVRR